MSGRRFVDSVEQRAAERLPEAVFRFVQRGSRDGVSAAEATPAWDRFRLLPQVMRDVTHVQTGSSFLGTSVRTPLGVAPTTMQRAAHPEGEVAMARAAAGAGALMVVSGEAGSSFEDIAATGVDWWLQTYVMAERHTGQPLLDRAVDAGAAAVVLTVDTPVVATSYDALTGVPGTAGAGAATRVNLPPGHGSSPGEEKATDLGPQDVEWLAKATGLPVVVKGVLRPSDARRCLEAGASAVWVSNHGGRQVDYAAATADRLAAVVAEAGSAEVYVDGGVCNGRHALVALALGARGVFLGRLPLYALAVDGYDGVRRMFQDLDEELVEALMLTGCPSVGRVPADLLAPPPPTAV